MSLMMYLVNKLLDRVHANKFSNAAEQQMLCETGGDCTIAGVDYYSLKVQMQKAGFHLALQMGDIKLPEFEKIYEKMKDS